MASTTLALVDGEAQASACSIVGMMRRASLVFVEAREQKKGAPSRLPRSRIFAQSVRDRGFSGTGHPDKLVDFAAIELDLELLELISIRRDSLQCEQDDQCIVQNKRIVSY